jgi:hypothetical protein
VTEPVLDYRQPEPRKRGFPLWWCSLISLTVAILLGLRTVDPQHPINRFVIAMFVFLAVAIISLLAAVIRAIWQRIRA